MARSRLIDVLVGRRYALPAEVEAAFPELGAVHWRQGGLPPRIGGWFLGRRTVAAITLGRVVFLAPGARVSAELLLHELAHVRQFASGALFPLQYLWGSLRRGYHRNRFEVDARRFAADRVQRAFTNAEEAVPNAASHRDVGHHHRAVHHRAGAPAPGRDGGAERDPV